MGYSLNNTFIKSFSLTGIVLTLLAASCKLKEEKLREMEIWQEKVDSTGNAILDSIYKLESLRCDSLQKTRLKWLVDSMVAVPR